MIRGLQYPVLDMQCPIIIGALQIFPVFTNLLSSDCYYPHLEMEKLRPREMR